MFRFKDFTTENKVQQSELMELFGLGQSTISNLVNGKIPTNKERLELLRAKFGSDLINKYIVPDEANNFIKEKQEPIPTDAMSIISSLIASNKAKDEELAELRKELVHLTRCFEALAEKNGSKPIEKVIG